MKKILFFAASLAGLLFAASCQQEMLEPVSVSNTVTFTVEAPGVMNTKGTINTGATIADGTNVNEVHYEVYKNETDVDHALLDPASLPMAKGVVPMSNKKANITLDLLQDQEYTVIFWAQVKNAGHYDTSDLRCIELAKEAYANDETRAAFFRRFDFDTYEHQDYPNIDLQRPFAQLNLLTTMESLKPVSTGQTSGYEIDAKTSQVTVTGLAASFNTVTGVGNGVNYPYTFNMYATPEDQGQSTLKVNGKEYHYVSMNYMFVPVDAVNGSAPVDIAYTIVTDKGSIDHEIVSVPIRENYRTNVIGNLFTKESKFEIYVDAEFDGQELVQVWDGREVSKPVINKDGVYEISTAAELAWLSAAVNGTLPVVVTKATETPKAQTFKGETFVLVEDIDLANPSIEIPTTWTPIGATGKFEGTFDGNGKTIRGLKVVAQGKAAAGLFANAKYVRNVTVDGAEITGQYKTGVIVGDGLCSRIDNCHVINSTVTVTPYNQDEANNVGGIVGYLSAENEAWVKDCSVTNSTITAYRKVGGIVGAANQKAEVTGNTVSNTTITADQTAEYKSEEDGNAGPVVGYKHSAATVAEGQEGENVTVIRKVDSTEELAYAVEDAQDGDVIYVGDGQVYMPAAAKGRTLQIEGIHTGATINVASSGGEGCDYTLEGSTVTFTKVNILTVDGNYKGYARPAQLTFNECTFPNTYSLYGNQSFSKCTFNVSGDKYNVWTWGANKAAFETCTFNCDGKSVLLYGYGPTELVMNGCTFNDNGDDTITGKAAIEIGNDYNATYSLTVNNATVNGFAINPNGTQTGTALWANKNSMTPDKLTVIIDGVRWDPKDPNTHDVYNLDELLKWAYMANNGQPALNLNLHADITLPAYEIKADGANKTYVYTETPITVTDGVPSGSNWVPVGSSTAPYCGMIKGNYHTISGMCIKDEVSGYVGFVGKIDGGATMEEADDNNYENIFIENITIDEASVYTTKTVSGLIAGYVRNIKGIKNCDVTNSIISGNEYTGGIIGYLYTRKSDNNVVMSDCSTDADTKVKGYKYVGGAVGYHYGSIIINCENAAAVNGTDLYVGGIAGYTRDYHHNRSAYIIACTNSGNVTSTSKYVGGIAGYNLFDANHDNSESCIVACSSTASVISGSTYVSLLVGDAYANSRDVVNDHHYGSWALKTPSVTTLVNGGKTYGCYAFGSAAEITDAEIAQMNAAIDKYNEGRSGDPAFCPYKWVLTAGGPELQ